MHCLRFADVEANDFHWAKNRHVSNLLPDERALFEDTYTLWLVPKRRDAHNLNLSLLERFHVELRARLGLQHAWVCPIRARDRGKVRGAHDDVGDLPPFVVLCRGSSCQFVC